LVVTEEEILRSSGLDAMVSWLKSSSTAETNMLHSRWHSTAQHGSSCLASSHQHGSSWYGMLQSAASKKLVLQEHQFTVNNQARV
jgi:hypothetical protein